MKTFEEIKVSLLEEYKSDLECWKKKKNNLNETDEKIRKNDLEQANKYISSYVTLIENIDERVRREIMREAIHLSKCFNHKFFNINLEISKLGLLKTDEEYKKLDQGTDSFIDAIAKHYGFESPNYTQTEIMRNSLRSDKQNLDVYYAKNGRVPIAYEAEMNILEKEEQVETNSYLLGQNNFDDLRTEASIKSFYEFRREQLRRIYESEQKNNGPMSM